LPEDGVDIGGHHRFFLFFAFLSPPGVRFMPPVSDGECPQLFQNTCHVLKKVQLTDIKKEMMAGGPGTGGIFYRTKMSGKTVQIKLTSLNNCIKLQSDRHVRLQAILCHGGCGVLAGDGRKIRQWML
jgi:hypothetical protein